MKQLKRPKGVGIEQFNRYVKRYGQCKDLYEVVSAACLTKHQVIDEKARERGAQLYAARVAWQEGDRNE